MLSFSGKLTWEEWMISRRNMMIGTTAVLGASVSLPSIASGVEINDDGLHVQDWFLHSFLDIREDQEEQRQQGKHLAVIFEQRGCPYCRELHEVNFSKPKIVNYIKKHFGFVQINLWGSREVTDLDGTQMEERELARKWGVNFTPTIIFLRDTDIEGIPIKLAEAARMPGYFKPFHFMSMLEYVSEKQYENKLFQRFLQEKFERYKAEGKKPDVW